MPPPVRHALLAMARRDSEREICGFILNNWAICPISNVADSKHDFRMAERELIEFYQANFNVVMGMYHSHPRGREDPSDTDIAYAPPRMRYWIVTPEKVVEWEIRDGAAEKVDG